MTQGEPADQPPSEELTGIVLDLFGVTLTGSSDAWRGEESIGWRGSSPDGDRFVQLFPTWRTVDELRWCDSVARTAATSAPACVHAVSSRDGITAVATSDGPVMVFPFVEGSHPADGSPAAEAAELLAAIHRGIALGWSTTSGTRPRSRRPARVAMDVLPDEELDRWERSALASAAKLPIHGDYYGGNLLVADGRIVGVVDWWDAQLTAQEREVAWAAWEFCQNDAGDDLIDDRAEWFLQGYVDAGGPASVGKPFDPCPWIRVRLRAEARAWFADPRSETETSDYHEAQLIAFERLRTRRLPGR
jgi:phosphotransferase family enzyme